MAGNARFHDKQHRRNHHTNVSSGYPDSATDPIASYLEPFQGDFILNGSLSAANNITINGNCYIGGNLSAYGTLSYLDTIVSVTSALSVINTGTATAFTVVQGGTTPIVQFISNGSSVLSGKDAFFIENNGQVVINGVTPAAGQMLTVYGAVSTNGTFSSGTIYSSGNVNALSDQNLKTNVYTITGALGIVNNLRGVSYDRIDTKDHTIGVIAQEIEKYLPEVVKSIGDFKTVSYGNIVGVLIEAIKELSTKVETLENQIKQK